MNKGNYRRVLPDRVDFDGNRAVFHGAVRLGVQRNFQVFVNGVDQRGYDRVQLDFRRATKAYPNSMVPILAAVQRLIHRGITVDCDLPSDENLRTLFLRANWAHFLDPVRFRPSDVTHDRHLSTKQFQDSGEQQRVVSEFIDIVMRTLEVERSFLAGLEWAINEITDNVLTHSESVVGGFVQLTTYKDAQRLAFCVADPGRGILTSLREAEPSLRGDVDAIADSVRAGVTRNKDVGQGNGLSGTMKIAMTANGRFLVASGSGWIAWQGEDSDSRMMPQTRQYRGTYVDVQLPLGEGIDLGKALSFGSKADTNLPIDVIETKYLSDDARKLTLKMGEETSGFGSRPAGKQIRTKAKNLIRSEPSCLLEVDWDGIQMISSSYADEFIGKLFVELGPVGFMNRVRQINMIPVVKQLIDKAIMQRVGQVAAGMESEREGED
jgi:anti-sigma regulatory factor (Ser/Thr protein kinase)